jgi:hypothetical protein
MVNPPVGFNGRQGLAREIWRLQLQELDTKDEKCITLRVHQMWHWKIPYV